MQPDRARGAREGREARGGRGVFLDRDGTLIEDTGYPADREQVRLIAGVGAAVKRLNEVGMPVVVVTNQSGIARGLFTRADFDAIEERLAEELAGVGAHLDGVYMCPHHPDFDGACDCRKPGLALYVQAAEELAIDLSRSFYIGDRWRDVDVTRSVGGTPILVSTGEGGDDAPPDIARVEDLPEAVERILRAVGEDA